MKLSSSSSCDKFLNRKNSSKESSGNINFLSKENYQNNIPSNKENIRRKISNVSYESDIIPEEEIEIENNNQNNNSKELETYQNSAVLVNNNINDDQEFSKLSEIVKKENSEINKSKFYNSMRNENSKNSYDHILCNGSPENIDSLSENSQIPKQRKIVVVEDNIIMNSSILKIINTLIDENKMNHRAIACFDGIDLLKEVIESQNKGHIIDLVIIDENMDYMNGSEALGILKKLEDRNRITFPKVVSSTSDISMNHRQKELKIWKIMPKPYNKSSLLSLFKELKFL